MNLINTISPLVILLPFLGFLSIGLNLKRWKGNVAGIIASTSVLASFVLALFIFVALLGNSTPHQVNLFCWINVGDFDINLSLYVDRLTSIMLLIVTGVGGLIHVYSMGYMHGDEGYNRFFAYLNLFVFFMLILVLASNYLVMFIGWEGVGLCSYLLIGFWNKNHENNYAANKAFVMNRIGDLGFIIGMALMFFAFDSLDFQTVFSGVTNFANGDTTLTLIAIFLFIGAMGKSAQIPLYTWLPDAMAGPTPVSALIHAATMVTAGVYMVARSGALFVMAPVAMELIAIVGAITAIWAAAIAIYQSDIKKVLAYSTVSQLGLMFVALGVGAFSSAVFHVMTHAFFKALLFLAAGSVIHALSGEQNILKMGGLKGPIRKTFLVFLMGTVAIAGIPPFSGFFSKDEILMHAYQANFAIWLVASLASLFTAFYMFRLLYLTFYGEYRGKQHHVHESPNVMLVPLYIIAILAVVAGFVGIPEFLGKHVLAGFLSPVFESANSFVVPQHLHLSTEIILILVAVGGALVSIYWAYRMFIINKIVPAEDIKKMSAVKKALYHKLYVDEVYNVLVQKPVLWFSTTFYKWIEQAVIDGLVRLAGSFTILSGRVLRLVQSGHTEEYFLIMVLAIVGILIYNLVL